MTDESQSYPAQAQVLINLPFADQSWTTIVRVHADDSALIGEQLAGHPIVVPLGTNYVASAVAPNGQPVCQPTRFNVEDGSAMTLNLEAKPGLSRDYSEAASAPDIFRTGVKTWGFSNLSTRFRPKIFADPELWLLPSREIRAFDSILFESTQGQRPSLMRFYGPRETGLALIPFDLEYGSIRNPDVNAAISESNHTVPDITFRHAPIRALQDALQHNVLAPVRSLAEEAIMNTAQEAMHDKVRSPLSAVLGGLLLLRDAPDRLERLEPWTRNLFSWFPWLPDTLPLRTELLARMGRHREAIEALNEVGERGAPWTREGLRILVARLASYEGRTNLEEPDLTISGKSILKFKNLLAETDPDCVYLYFHSEISELSW
ncbi:MAG: hypothetical protein AB2758_17700 [Candidatus Thiodiazotropha endolucinida]